MSFSAFLVGEPLNLLSQEQNADITIMIDEKNAF